VHGRTVAQKYVGPSRRAFLTTVKQAYADRVIIGSGDLFDELDVVAMVRETGVDGAWVARGGIGAPWIFSAIEHALRTGERAPPPSFSDQRRAVWMHHRESTTLHGRELGSRLFRSAAIKYAEAHPLGDVVKHAIYDCRVPADVEAVLKRYYDVDLTEDHFGPVRHREGPGNLVAAGASCG
jgi:tRNA-dihydrouridine synthase